MASIHGNPNAFLIAVENELTNRVRAGLKKPLMEMAEAMVDKAVDEAIEGLKPQIKAYHDLYRDSTDLNIIVNRVAPVN